MRGQPARLSTAQLDWRRLLVSRSGLTPDQVARQFRRWRFAEERAQIATRKGSMWDFWNPAPRRSLRHSARRLAPTTTADLPTAMWSRRGSNRGCSIRCRGLRADQPRCPRRCSLRDTDARPSADSRSEEAQPWPLTPAAQMCRPARTTTEIWRSGAAYLSRESELED